MYYAHGGDVEEGLGDGSQLAHFNTDELALMDEMQGGKTLDPKTGLPEYFVLNDMLSANPSLLEVLAESFLHLHHAHGHHSQHEDLHEGFQQIAEEGRMGDTELAIIPDTLADMLDSIIGGPQINPETGLREYFLGALLGLVTRFLPSIIGGATRVGSMAARGAGMLGRSAGMAARSAGRLAGTAGRAAGNLGRTVARATPGALRTVGNAARSGLQTAGKYAPAAMRFANDSGLTGMAGQYLMDKMMPQSAPDQYADGGYDDGSGYGAYSPAPIELPADYQQDLGSGSDYGAPEDYYDPRNSYYR